MQILEIKFKNFKQYYGEQSLEFCVSDNSSDKNVTVVYGENGRGKTSIYRALIFALYGDTKLEQDLDNRSSYENSDEKIYTVNTKSIEEDYKNGKNGVKAFVEVTFLHNNSEYVIKREIEGIKDENQIFEQHGDVRLKYVDESNNTVILKNKDKEKIKNIINDILDERMKNYFLFDGEKIENLTRATKEQKQEVSKGIKNLLKIDNLKSSIDSLNKLERKINKELKKISTGKYKKTLKDIEEKEKQVDLINEKIKEKEKKLKKAKKSLKEVNKELESFKKHEDKIRNRKNLIKELQELENNKKEISDKIKDFNNQAIIFAAEDLINSAYGKIEDINISKIDKSSKENIVNNIIEQMECICGNKIEMNSNNYKSLMLWKESATDNENNLNEKVKYLRDNMMRTLQFIEDKKPLSEQYLSEFAKTDQNIEEINSRIQKLDNKIGDVDDEEFLDKENFKKEIEREISALEIKIEKDREKLFNAEKKLEELKKRREELSEEQNIKNDFTENLKLVESTKNKLNSIKNDFIVEVKENLESKATEIFSLLIDDEKLNTFKKIKVNDDYSLQIYDWNNNPFLANISKGQRQIMSLSFITALALVAGGNDSLDMPLFMDTPFGRLSGQHRDNLLNEIPELTPQWILLATDTEFTNVEANELRETGKWGKIYKLNLVENGYTKIVEKNINTFTPNR